jgi:hypothetical protein
MQSRMARQKQYSYYQLVADSSDFFNGCILHKAHCCFYCYYYYYYYYLLLGISSSHRGCYEMLHLLRYIAVFSVETFHHQGRRISQTEIQLAYSSTLKIEATCSSGKSMGFQRATWRYIAEGITLHLYCCFIVIWSYSFNNVFSTAKFPEQKISQITIMRWLLYSNKCKQNWALFSRETVTVFLFSCCFIARRSRKLHQKHHFSIRTNDRV